MTQAWMSSAWLTVIAQGMQLMRLINAAGRGDQGS
jgi:hypothetical protein